MVRPKKNNADYFPHDSGMRNDRKIKALRSKYGHVGYSVYVMLIESLTDADFFELRFDEINIEILAGDFDVESIELCNIVDYCKLLGLVQGGCDAGKVWSERHKKNFINLIRKRKRDRSGVIVDENPVFDVENPQSRVKESKVKKSKEKREKKTTFSPPQLDEVLPYFSEKESSDQDAEKFFDHFTANGWKVSGKAPMKDWKAAARNWIRRSKDFTGNKKQQSEDFRETLAMELLNEKQGNASTDYAGNERVARQIQG